MAYANWSPLFNEIPTDSKPDNKPRKIYIPWCLTQKTATITVLFRMVAVSLSHVSYKFRFAQSLIVPSEATVSAP